MSLDIFNHLDFQTLLNYEEIISDPESHELYDIHKEGHEKWGRYISLHYKSIIF